MEPFYPLHSLPFLFGKLGSRILKRLEKKCWGILIVLFMSIAILMDLHVPAKLPEKNEGENVQKYTYKKGIGEDHLVLLTALAASKGSLEYTNITIWGQSIGENYSLDDMEDIVLDCDRLLGLEEGSIIENFQ